MNDGLRARLAGLPDEAFVPVTWVRSLLDAPREPTLVAELTVEAFAKLMDRSPATVRAWCAAREIPGAYRLPGKRRPGAWRIPTASVIAFRERLSGLPPTLVATPERQASTTEIGAWRKVGRQLA